MNVGSVSSSTYGNIRIQKTEKSDTIKNYSQSVTLEADKKIDLGTIDDKPFEMRLFQNGGFEWSGGLFLKAPQGGSKVTPEQAAAAYAFDSYTRTEHERANDIGAVICAIYHITNRGQPTSSFYSAMNNGKKILPEEMEDALGLLGINPDEPFTINGRTFVLDSGTLKDYKEAEQKDF